MNAGRDFLLFIFFLVVLGIAWFLTGGPSRTISHSGWFLNGQGVEIPSVLPAQPLNTGTTSSN